MSKYTNTQMHIIKNTYLKRLKCKVDQSRTYSRDEMSKMKKVISKPMHNSRINTYNDIKSDTQVIQTFNVVGKKNDFLQDSVSENKIQKMKLKKIQILLKA